MGRTRLRRSPNNSDAREEVSWVWGQEQHRTNTSQHITATTESVTAQPALQRHQQFKVLCRYTEKIASLGIDEAAQHTASVFLSKSAARVDDYDIQIAQYDSNKDRLIPSAALVKEAAKHACAAA